MSNEMNTESKATKKVAAKKSTSAAPKKANSVGRARAEKKAVDKSTAPKKSKKESTLADVAKAVELVHPVAEKGIEEAKKDAYLEGIEKRSDVEVKGIGKKLGDIMPELRTEELQSWRAAGLVDVEVSAIYHSGDEIEADDGEMKTAEEVWPGKSKYITVWVTLVDGHAVGRHEGPRGTISYHMLSKKSMNKVLAS